MGGQTGDILLVCAGTDSAIALEDVFAAGRLCAKLGGPRTDAALVAEAVARAYRTPLQALAASADAAALNSASLSGDIADCARVSTLDVVPQVIAASGGVAVVASARGEEKHQSDQVVDSGYTFSF